VKTKSQFTIFVNGTELLFKIPGTKLAAQRHIKVFLKDTHMGRWVKVHGGYEYETTIGKYYSFLRLN
jgi:hypothetical protein